MERIISEQDRIRRAEEIAGRRRGTISARDINVEHTKKKMPITYKSFYSNNSKVCAYLELHIFWFSTIIQQLKV